MKALLVAVLAVLSISNLQADQTNVFCSKIENDSNINWGWLTDHNGNITTISGQWGEVVYPDQSGFGYFTVLEAEYQSSDIKCKAKFTIQHVAQPADANTSRWYRFKVTTEAGGQYYAPGLYDMNTSISTYHYLDAF